MEKIINNSISFFKDILIQKNPFFQKINVLDSFTFINYKGLLAPRILLDSNNSNNFMTLKQIFYPSIEEIDFFESNNDKGKSYMDDKVINEKKTKNLFVNDIANLMKKSNFYSMEINNSCNDIIYKENLKYLKCLFKDKNNYEPVPPKGIISAINSGNLAFNDVNKLILDNIYLLSQYNNIFNIFMNYNPIKHKENSTYREKTSNFVKFTDNIQEISLSSIKSIFDSNILLKPIFEVKSIKNCRSKKRGRKPNTNKKFREHKANDDDNLFRKLQVHYISFIINFVNDVIKSIFTMKHPPLFKYIAYEVKKNVNSKYVNELKSKSISEILQLKVSPKIKVDDKYINKKIYQKVIDLCPFLNYFFQQKYLHFFKDYYCSKNKKFEVYGQIIQVSSRTKTFNDLIEKNGKSKENLKYICAKYLVNSYKAKSSNIF